MKYKIHSWHEATQTDWYGLSGMEPFPSGQSPLLSDEGFTLTDETDAPMPGKYLAILDGAGLAFIGYDEDNGEHDGFNIPYAEWLRILQNELPSNSLQQSAMMLFDMLFPGPERRISALLIHSLGGRRVTL